MVLDLLSKDEANTKNDNFEAKTLKLFELLENHYTNYKSVNDEQKAELIKKYLFELFIDHKKDLQIEESPLFKSLKIFKFLLWYSGIEGC